MPHRHVGIDGHIHAQRLSRRLSVQRRRAVPQTEPQHLAVDQGIPAARAVAQAHVDRERGARRKARLLAEQAFDKLPIRSVGGAACPKRVRVHRVGGQVYERAPEEIDLADPHHSPPPIVTVVPPEEFGASE